MKKTLFAVLLSLWVVSALQARILTVEYGAGTGGQYHTLQAAHDAANRGDTVFVIPPAACAGMTVTKKLTIYGTGFGAPDSGMPMTLISGTITFGPGSAGSKLIGFGGSFSLVIIDSNISIIKNWMYNLVVYPNIQNISILNNYFSNNGDDHICLNVEAFVSGNILNNMFRSGGIEVDSAANINIINNFINGRPSIISWGGNCDIVNNFLYRALIGNYYDDSHNIVMEGWPSNACDSFFVDCSHDNFHLKPGSPAIGAGLHGWDIGVYGGPTPFIDGGAPDLPLITNLKTNGLGTKQGGLSVQIKARSGSQ